MALPAADSQCHSIYRLGAELTAGLGDISRVAYAALSAKIAGVVEAARLGPSPAFSLPSRNDANAKLEVCRLPPFGDQLVLVLTTPPSAGPTRLPMDTIDGARVFHMLTTLAGDASRHVDDVDAEGQVLSLGDDGVCSLPPSGRMQRLEVRAPGLTLQAVTALLEHGSPAWRELVFPVGVVTPPAPASAASGSAAGGVAAPPVLRSILPQAGGTKIHVDILADLGHAHFLRRVEVRHGSDDVRVFLDVAGRQEARFTVGGLTPGTAYRVTVWSGPAGGGAGGELSTSAGIRTPAGFYDPVFKDVSFPSGTGGGALVRVAPAASTLPAPFSGPAVVHVSDPSTCGVPWGGNAAREETYQSALCLGLDRMDVNATVMARGRVAALLGLTRLSTTFPGSGKSLYSDLNVFLGGQLRHTYDSVPCQLSADFAAPVEALSFGAFSEVAQLRRITHVFVVEKAQMHHAIRRALHTDFPDAIFIVAKGSPDMEACAVASRIVSQWPGAVVVHLGDLDGPSLGVAHRLAVGCPASACELGDAVSPGARVADWAAEWRSRRGAALSDSSWADQDGQGRRRDVQVTNLLALHPAASVAVRAHPDSQYWVQLLTSLRRLERGPILMNALTAACQRDAAVGTLRDVLVAAVNAACAWAPPAPAAL